MSHDLRFRKLEDAWGIRPLSPEDEATEEQTLEEMLQTWEQVSAEEHAWHARLRSGKVEVRTVKVDWSPVIMTHFTEGGEECLMSLASSLYTYFFAPPEEGIPHAGAGDVYPETAREVADFLESGENAERLAALIVPARHRMRTDRMKQGFSPAPDWWKD